MRQEIKQRVFEWKSILVFALVVLYPALAVTVKHSGGVFFYLLVISGVFYGWSFRRELAQWEKRLFFGFLLFAVAASLSFVNEYDMHAGFARLERYLHFPLAFFAYLFLRRTNLNLFRPFILGLYLASFVIFLDAIFETQILGRFRAEGNYNAILFGDVSMLIATLVAIYLVVFKPAVRELLLGVICVFLAVTASILSGSKGAWLLIPFVVTGITLLYWKSISLRHALTTVLIVIAFSGVGYLLKVAEMPQISYAMAQFKTLNKDSISQSDTTFRARISLWEDSITIWKEHPLLGTGLGDFRHDSDELLMSGKSIPRNQYDHAHSILFDMLATSGIVGLVSLVVFIFILPVFTFYVAWKKAGKNRFLTYFTLSGMVVIVALFVFGLTEGWLARNPFVRVYVLFTILMLYFVQYYSPKETSVENAQELASVTR